MDVETLLARLKTLADGGTLGADVAARDVEGDAVLLAEAASVADGRARAAVGTADFQGWTDVALACTRAIGLSVEGTTR
jgi:hypothetical protein